MRPISFRQLRKAVLFFFVFFSITAVAQYLFVDAQTEDVLNTDRQRDAAELNDALAYDGGFDAARYAKTQVDATNFVIVLNDGSIIDLSPEVSGPPISILPPVRSPILSDAAFTAPVNISYRNGSKIAEKWRIFARKLDRGYVIVGTSEYDNAVLSDDQFSANLDLFGETLTTAAKHTPAKYVDKVLSWVLVDERGTLVNGLGRLPLKTDAMQIGRASSGSPYRKSGDKIYYLSFMPLTDKGGNQVGTILLFDDVTQWKSALINLAQFSGGIAV